MAENPIIMSVVNTTASRLPDLTIENGQLIFIRDKQRIALDYDDKRTFYNQIIMLQTDEERQSLLAPVQELYYFVMSTATLWTYHSGWVQITIKAEDVVYIGDDLPDSGVDNRLYVSKNEKNISVWDSTENGFMIVSDCTTSIDADDISNLFSN